VFLWEKELPVIGQLLPKADPILASALDET
jgi:hypothetical protein